MLNGTNPIEKTSGPQMNELLYMWGNIFKKMPSKTAKKILGSPRESRRFLTEICKKFDIPYQSEHTLTQLPLLEKYYQEVYGITLDLSEIVFPENQEFSSIMVDDLSQDEDQVMDCIKNYFNKKESPVNLYKYKNPVAENIDRESEKLQIRQLQSGLVVFAHKGGDEPDLLNMSYNTAVENKIQFAKYREYLRMTGFHRFIKGYFMDRKGWTRTSSKWTDGYLVDGYWDDGRARLYAGPSFVGLARSNGGPRQLFLSLS